MKKSAFIAVVGRANVGKSSFVNRAVGEKVAIVSDKPQTTRTKIMGVLNREETQIVFIDTPGFHKPHNTLGENMMKAVGAGLSDVDAAVFMVEAVTRFKFDPDNLPPAELKLMEEIKKRKIPAILAVNKIDLLEDKAELLPIIEAYSRFLDFEAVVPFSAKNGDGADILVNELMSFAKESVHYFDDDTVTDQSERTMVAEMIREKLLRTLDNEVPHGIAIDLEQFFESDTREGEPILNVSAVIYCERESHKGIIIGKKGALLKKIGTLARKDIEEFYGIRVSLKLWVKVKENWRSMQGAIHGFGLD
ncbi:MAG: GTPase Era [Clostridia bacterium]|nr:GTPase Era [Clostridia bacterium]